MGFECEMSIVRYQPEGCDDITFPRLFKMGPFSQGVNIAIYYLSINRPTLARG